MWGTIEIVGSDVNQEILIGFLKSIIHCGEGRYESMSWHIDLGMHSSIIDVDKKTYRIFNGEAYSPEGNCDFVRYSEPDYLELKNGTKRLQINTKLDKQQLLCQIHPWFKRVNCAY